MANKVFRKLNDDVMKIQLELSDTKDAQYGWCNRNFSNEYPSSSATMRNWVCHAVSNISQLTQERVCSDAQRQLGDVGGKK